MRDTETDILYEDENIIVCVKPANVDSEKMAALLGDKTNREIFCVHRLDAPVGGVMHLLRLSWLRGGFRIQLEKVNLIKNIWRL